MFRPTMTTILRRNGASLGTLTPEALVDAALAALGSEGTPWATPAWRPALVALAAEVLAEEQGRRAAAPLDPKAQARAAAEQRRKAAQAAAKTAPIGAYDGEPVTPYETVYDAREAVLDMIRDLADMPDPTRKDDVGFSVSTNSALRAFLARAGGSATLTADELTEAAEREDVRAHGAVPLTARDWLRAARLLLTHSKTQLPRADVLGAIRAMEAKIGADPLPPKPNVKNLDPADYGILTSAGTRRGATKAEAGGVKWELPLHGRAEGARRFTVPAALWDQLESVLRGRVRMAVTRGPQRVFEVDVGREQGAEAGRLLVRALADAGETAVAARVGSALDAARDEARHRVAAAAAAQAAAPAAAPAIPAASPLVPAPLAVAPPQAPAAPVPRDGPPSGGGFPDAVMPPGDAPSGDYLAEGHAGPFDRRKGGTSDFDAVKWKWDGGMSVMLAFSLVQGEAGWSNLRFAVPELRALEDRRSPSFRRPRDRGYDEFFSYPVKAAPQIAEIMDGRYRSADAGNALRRLAGWWRWLAEPEEDVNDPLARGKAGFEQGVTWRYVPEENVVELTLPYDPSRDNRNQLVVAMKSANVLYRRVGEKGGTFWITAENVEKLIEYMVSTGRLASSIPLLRELLPYWRQLAVMFERKGTRAEVEKAESLLRRLRFTMEPATVRAVYERIAAFAPYLAGVKPGTSRMDLGPYGTWAVVNRGKGQTPREFIDIYMLGMSPEVRKLAKEEIESERPALDQNGKPLLYPSGKPRMKYDHGYTFPIESLEILAHALDKSGLMPLAMSLRGALLVDEAGRNCAVQDALASATNLESVTLPEARALVMDVMRDAPAVLAPGVKLREYQAIGVAFMRANQYHAILGDEPGLGKTLQVLAALALAPDKLPALIIAPTSVVGVWAREAGIFTPGLRVRTARAKGKLKVGEAIHNALRAQWDLLVIGWDSLRLAADELIAAAEAHRWRTVVMDEAHTAKNRGTARGQAIDKIARLAPGGVIAITGTLVENDPDEAWAVLDMVVPGAYGTKAEYRKKYSNASDRQVAVYDATTGEVRVRKIQRFERPDGQPYRNEDAEDLILTQQEADEQGEGGGGLKPRPRSDKERLLMLLAELRVALRCDMIRRLKDEVFTQLPELVVDLVPVSLDDVQTDAYGAVMDALPDWINSAVRYDLANKAAEQIVAAQSVGEPIDTDLAIQRALVNRLDLGDLAPVYARGEMLLDKGEVDTALQSFKVTRAMVAFGGLRRLMGEYKAPVVLDMADEYIRTHETPLLIFAEHKPVVAFLRDNLIRKGYRVGVITGETPPPRRDGIVARFQKGELDVLIGSTALRQGVTLTAADEAIFAEIWWNPAWINQAEMRIHRADDRTLAKKSVRVQHVYAENTVDEAVANTVIEKREIIDAVLGGIVGATPEAQLMQKVMGEVLKKSNKLARDESGQSLITPTRAEVNAALKGTLKGPKKLNAGEVIVAEAAAPSAALRLRSEADDAEDDIDAEDTDE